MRFLVTSYSGEFADSSSPAAPMEQPAPREMEPWDEPQSASGFDDAPAPLPAEPAGVPEADPMEGQAFSSPALPSEIMDE